MRWFEAKPLMNNPLQRLNRSAAGLGQLGGALLDHSPFLVKLIVDPALGSPLLLLADIVEAAGERVGGLGESAQAIVESGSGVDAAVLGGEPLDEVLACFPDRRRAVGWRLPFVGQLVAFEQTSICRRSPRRSRRRSCRRAKRQRHWSC